MDLTLLAQALVSGVLAAGLYALVSVGLALAIGVIGIVNFAHGEFFMIGAFLAYQAVRLVRDRPRLVALAGGARPGPHRRPYLHFHDPLRAQGT
jgi:branched-subunit amino acid ABC-type transport system permease component